MIDTPMPQPKITALLGSLKKSISPIFLPRFNYLKSSKDGRNPKTYVDSVKFCIWTIHKEE